MSHNISVEPLTPTSSNLSINPVLQAALGSIDVQLEEELARYRRQRAGRPVMSSRGLGRHQIRKPIDLISVNKGANKTQRPALGMSTAPKISLPLMMVNPAPTAEPPQEVNREPIAQMGQLDTPAFAEPPPSSLVAHSRTNTAAENSVGSEQLTPPAKSTEGSGGLVPLGVAQAQPEDYLESSEKLLRSLSEEAADPKPQKRFSDKFLTPLGVGSMLLLLLSSATVAYIFTNPSTLSALGVNRLFERKTTNTAQKPTETTQPKVTPVEDSPPLKGPNLASEEFPEVNLDTLSQLETSPSPIPSSVTAQPELPNPEVTTQAPPVVSNSALPAGGASDLSTALLPPTIARGTAPSRVAQVAPLPAPPAPPAAVRRARKSNPSPAKPKVSKPATPAATKKTNKASVSPKQVAANPAPAKKGGYYFVVTNYGSDRDLNKVRTIVPDAYVRNLSNGSRIQMGAFKRESEAKTMVNQLKQQGITASIYNP